MSKTYFINASERTGEVEVFRGAGGEHHEADYDFPEWETAEDLAEQALVRHGLRTTNLKINEEVTAAQPTGWVSFEFEAEDVSIQAFKVGVPKEGEAFKFSSGDLVIEEELAEVHTVDTMEIARTLMKVWSKERDHLQREDVAKVVRDELESQGIFERGSK